MKALFLAIRQSNLEKVKEILRKDSTLVNCCAKQPPKKDDGQSPLEVAIKSGQPQIAHYLIEKGADVNFISSSKINEWHMPVIHSAIRACIFSAVDTQQNIFFSFFNFLKRLLGKNSDSQSSIFEQYFDLLEKLLNKGANIHATDSYGNTCMHRAFLDASQLTSYYSNREAVNNIKKVIRLLKVSGASFSRSTNSKKAVKSNEMFRKHPVAMFFSIKS